MLEQLVYTRGKPRLNICSGGEVIPSDGFGVMNVSAGLIPSLSAEQAYFVNGRAGVKNGSSESAKCGLFHSYEYNRLEDGRYLLSFEYSRRVSDDTTIPGTSRYTGIFVKQCLLGNPAGYPYEWIGADVWDAWRVLEADYRRSERPPVLPQVPDAPFGGSITREAIRAFLQDGRLEAARDALWFVLEQLAKPVSKRQVLLIRDTPEQTALWVAALQNALPVGMAQALTFATNRTQLDLNLQTALYSTAGSPSERRPYCMVVGFHPKDPFCASVQAGVREPFELLDGETCSLSFRPTAGASALRFFAAALMGEEDVRQFYAEPFGELPVEQAIVLPVLYEDWQWLSGAPADYAQLRRHIERLFRFDWSGHDAFLRRTAGRAAQGAIDCLSEDEANGWPLCAALYPRLCELGQEHLLKNDLLRCLLGAGAPSGGVPLIRLAERARANDFPSGLMPLLRELFSEQFLHRLTAWIQEPNRSGEAVCALMSLYLFQTREDRASDASILRGGGAEFLQAGLMAISANTDQLRPALAELCRRPKLFETIALLVTSQFQGQNPQAQMGWLTELFAIPGYEPLPLYQKFRTQNIVAPYMLEDLLIQIYHQQNSDHEGVLREFRELSASNEGIDGTRFYLFVLERTAQEDLDEIIREIRSANLTPEAQYQLWRAICVRVPYPSEQNDTHDTLLALRKWGKEVSTPNLPFVSNRLELYHLCCRILASETEEKAIALLRADSLHFWPNEANNEFYESDCFRQAALHTAEFLSPSLHAELILSCRMWREKLHCPETFVARYVDLLLLEQENTGVVSWLKDRVLRKTPAYLEYAAALLYAAEDIHQEDPEETGRVVAAIRSQTLQALREINGKTLSRDLDRYQKSDPKAAEYLRKYLSRRRR